MARIAIPGTLRWTLSSSADVVKQRIYMDIDGNGVNYADVFIEIYGNTNSIQLPVEGLPPAIEGITQYGITALDCAGNESDMAVIDVEYDVTPPKAPTRLEFIPNTELYEY